MRAWFLLAGLTLLALDVVTTRSATLPEEASGFIFEYEVMVSELEAPLQQLREHYVNHLGQVEAAVQRAGSLEGVLEVRKERERAESKAVESAPPITTPPELVKARQIYLNEMSKARERLVPALEQEKRHLRERLAKLQDEMTRIGKLDQAQAIKLFLESGALEVSMAAEKEPAYKSTGSLKVKLQVDGVSHLMIQGDDIWYDHRRGKHKAPGLHMGEFPTYLDDDREWIPDWREKVTERFDAEIGLPGKEPSPELRIRVSDGRGYAEVEEQPSASNDYTATIVVRDETPGGSGFGGSDWLEFRIDW